MNGKRYRFDGTGRPVENIILSSIPTSEFQLIEKYLKRVVLRVGLALHDPHDGIRYSYFLNTGLASLVVRVNDGKTVEVGIAGHEGMTGVGVVAGLSRTIHRAVVQVAGEGFRISAAALKAVLPSTPALQKRSSLFAAIQSMQIAQTAACNRLHDVRQRMARWLLMTNDRVGAPTLSVTHDFLSTILGTDRASVTERAISLQERGSIQYSRGKLRILDRNKLQSDACECYRATRRFNHELGLA